MAEDEKRELRVVEISTGKVVERIDVSGNSERYVEAVERGLLRNMNREEYCVEDSKYAGDEESDE